jgi:hypothetical protein
MMGISGVSAIGSAAWPFFTLGFLVLALGIVQNGSNSIYNSDKIYGDSRLLLIGRTTL